MVAEDTAAERSLRRTVHRRARAALTRDAEGTVRVGRHAEGTGASLRLRLRAERAVAGAERTIVDTTALHVAEGTVAERTVVVRTIVVLRTGLCPRAASRLVDITATVTSVVPAMAHA